MAIRRTPPPPPAPSGAWAALLEASNDLLALLDARGHILWVNGGFEYNDANTERQKAYSLTNFRAGLRGRYAFVEGWIKNAFDTRYIPIAFAYGSFAPSGFVGEMGAPRRAGVSMGVNF